jgi:hypothetical protein
MQYLALTTTRTCPGPPADTGEFDSDTMIVNGYATPVTRLAPP